MTKSAEFGVPTKATVKPGTCRVCGCTRVTACDVPTDYGSRACKRVDDTLCDAPPCLEAARAEIVAKPEEAMPLERQFTGQRYGFAPGQ